MNVLIRKISVLAIVLLALVSQTVFGLEPKKQIKGEDAVREYYDRNHDKFPYDITSDIMTMDRHGGLIFGYRPLQYIATFSEAYLDDTYGSYRWHGHGHGPDCAMSKTRIHLDGYRPFYIFDFREESINRVPAKLIQTLTEHYVNHHGVKIQTGETFYEALKSVKHDVKIFIRACAFEEVQGVHDDIKVLPQGFMSNQYSDMTQNAPVFIGLFESHGIVPAAKRPIKENSLNLETFSVESSGVKCNFSGGNRMGSCYFVAVTQDGKNIMITHCLITTNRKVLALFKNLIIGEANTFEYMLRFFAFYSQNCTPLNREALCETAKALIYLSWQENPISFFQEKRTQSGFKYSTVDAAGATLAYGQDGDGGYFEFNKQPTSSVYVHPSSQGNSIFWIDLNEDKLKKNEGGLASGGDTTYIPNKEEESVVLVKGIGSVVIFADGKVLGREDNREDGNVTKKLTVHFKRPPLKPNTVQICFVVPHNEKGYGTKFTMREPNDEREESVTDSNEAVEHIASPSKSTTTVTSSEDDKDALLDADNAQSLKRSSTETVVHQSSTGPTIISPTAVVRASAERQELANTPKKQLSYKTWWRDWKPTTNEHGYIIAQHQPGSPNDFLFDLPLTTFNRDHKSVELKVTITEGSIGFGLLSSNRLEWIVPPQNTSGTGVFTLTLTPPEGNGIPMVVDRSKAKDSPLSFVITDIIP